MLILRKLLILFFIFVALLIIDDIFFLVYSKQFEIATLNMISMSHGYKELP